MLSYSKAKVFGDGFSLIFISLINVIHDKIIQGILINQGKYCLQPVLDYIYLIN